MKRFFVFTLLLLGLTAAPALDAQSFSVLGLFHPRELELQPAGGSILSVSSGLEDTPRVILNCEAAHRRLVFRASANNVIADGRSGPSWTIAGRDNSTVPFELAVPGKLRRVYRGRLTLTAHNGELLAVVTMDLDTAVASIVAAEMPPSAPLEALKAQAVVARAFLAAGGRHRGFDFCDTTHCQFLRSPPASGSAAARAAEATRGMVLAYRGEPLAAMYSSRCGGQTRSLREAGMNPVEGQGDGYPYFSVRCAWCRRHPQPWHTRIPADGPAPQPGNEPDRIRQARQWGWSALPGSDFTASRDGSEWVVEGRGVGHGVGMCQAGAIGMASSGAGFREILRHYYPNTEIVLLP